MMIKRMTGLLAATGLVAASAAVALASPAMANGCGNTVLDQTSFGTFFDTSETRTGGHNVIDASNPNALHVYTDSNTSVDKAAAYQTGLSIPLADQTNSDFYSLTVNNTSGGGIPGYQLIIDANGSAAGGFATLVYEPASYGEGQWWSNSAAVQGVAPGAGYAHLGTLDQYSQGNPDAVITAFGYSLGSGVKGDVLLTQIEFGCNTFSFQYTPPAPVNQAPDAQLTATAPDANGNVTFTSQSTDDSGVFSQHLDYGDGTSVDGDQNANGPVTHTYAPGTYTAVLTVTDAQGLSDTDSETITFTVAPPTNTGPTGPLANTGASVIGAGVLGLLTLGGGGLMLASSRRRKASTTV